MNQMQIVPLLPRKWLDDLVVGSIRVRTSDLKLTSSLESHAPLLVFSLFYILSFFLPSSLVSRLSSSLENEQQPARPSTQSIPCLFSLPPGSRLFTRLTLTRPSSFQ